MQRKRLTLPILLALCIGSVYLGGCGGSGGSGGARTPIALTGQLLDSVGGQPVAGAMVGVMPVGQSGWTTTTTDASGRFQIMSVPDGSSLVVDGSSDGRWNIYQISVSPGVRAAMATFYFEPVAASVQVPTTGVGITPSLQNPVGRVTITSPKENATVIGEASSTPTCCRFSVSGTSSLILGKAGSGYHVYLLVINTGSSGIFVQFPEVTIDPSTGSWSAEAQIDPTTEGFDGLQLNAFVTTSQLPLPSSGLTTRYSDFGQIPGCVSFSAAVMGVRAFSPN